MGKSQAQSAGGPDSVWLAGFNANDFMIPVAKTEISQVASALTRVVLDFGEADATSHEELTASSGSAEASDTYMEVLKAWGEDETDSDWVDRRVSWPLFDSDEFQPAASAEKRIEDNINAIKVLRNIQDSKRAVTDGDRAKLLRYCGWGGLARVFAPDGSSPQPWAPYRDELQALMSESDFAQMRSSITSAFFTDPAIVEVCWKIARHLGFQGGRVLEPSGGTGRFLAGIPRELAMKSDITAVELESVSAGIMEACFGSLGVQVHTGALEKARLPVAFYDLIIGNIPFGEWRSLDTSTADYANWSVHNYFLGKSIDLVRPGGLIVLITSRHSLDSKTNSHRKWLAAHAELIAGYRLPTMAFKSHANTEAVTDILVFKRREVPDYRAGGWIDLGQASDTMLKPGQSDFAYSSYGGTSYKRDRSINSYYIRNPSNVIGFLEWEKHQHGESLNPKFDGDVAALQAALEARVDLLPEGVYVPDTRSDEPAPRSSMQRYGLESYISPGAFVVKDERICISEGDELLDVDSMYSGTAKKRIVGMIRIKAKAIRVIEHQASSDDDVVLARLQGELNEAYDEFVNANGYLSTSANSRLMRSDPDWPIMLALEIWDDEADKAHKADIFFRRTVGHRKPPEKVDNVKDAMLISLAMYGRIVLKDLSMRMGRPVMQVVKELSAQALAFRDPEQARWVPADEYLSGHIRDKIAAAKAAGPAYEANIPALEAVLPKDLGPIDVEARLGAPWIPVDVIEQFASELVNDKKNSITVSFEASSASWSLKSTSWRIESIGEHVLQTSKWGTTKRCALVLLEAALNQQPPTITVEVDDRRVVDRMATLSAREKWQAIRDQFRTWVYQDAARRDRLLRIYNDEFNQIVVRKYDGSHLLLQGMSSVVEPYRHQLNAIWRIIVNGNTLLAHCVGAGKTLIMCAASMELRRLGKAAKPLHVVPNHMLEQYAAEFVRLYPQAKVLIASKDDLHGDKRRTFVARVATGDWDSVLMTQATFERLPLSPDLQRDFIERMLGEARTAASMANDHGAKRSLKEIEKRLKDHEAKLERLVSGGAKDADSVWFDELGVDQLMYDEAHGAKNLARISKMPRIAGLPNTASQRAFDVFMKTRVLMDERGGKQEGVVMATATCLTNSLAELHTFQVYLQPKTLKRMGVYEFDAWSASFGESVTGIELSPDGGGYRMNTRFCRFVNVADLMAIFRQVADIQTKRMLNLPTPVIEGGKPQVMVAKPSEELLAIVSELVQRADKIRSGQVRPEEDNMLSVTNDGRRAALDVRLVQPMLPFDPNGKLALAADNMYRIWNEGHALKTTQLVFSDLGTPGGSGFDVYAEVKRLLVERGVPAAQIEFIHDHKSDKAKAKLFKRVRDGLVRFLLGSTLKMGIGTNVQTRLKAIHQLDAPWVPSDVEQRDGRGDRQGNLNESIELWRYLVERSFDAYSWNLLTIKAGFIEQVMTAESGLRTVEDISMSALSYAEIKAIASGNPLVMEKAGIDADVQRLTLLRSQWEDERWRLSHREASLISRMNWIDQNMSQVEEDAKLSAGTGPAPVFVPLTDIAQQAVEVAGNGLKGMAAAFRAHSNRGLSRGEAYTFGRINGFYLDVTKIGPETTLYVSGPNSKTELRVDRPHMNDLDGVGLAVLNTIRQFATAPAGFRREYGEKAETLATTRKLLAVEFEHAERLERLRCRQREIEAELDLDKDAEGTQTMASESV